MKQTLKRTIIAGAAAALLAAPAMVSAEEGSGGTGSTGSGVQTTSPSPKPSESPNSGTDRQRQFETQLQEQLQQMRQARQTTVQTAKADLQEKLDNAKKKACENHQTTINRLMNVMDKRRQNALDRITKIAEAVEAFYVKKQLSVANYDDLVAKVNAAKAVAESATQAQQQIPSLDCSGDHPRADVADFKEKRSGSIDAVKAYRDAVKDLVKAVKTAVGGDTHASTSPTPKPDTEGGNQ
jgi:chromosome segregation ATPase